MSKPRLHNRNTYLRHKCRCEACCADALAYKRKYNASNIKLDCEPLVNKLAKDGRLHAVSRDTIKGWRNNGMNVFVADRWAVKLGYHPYEIWGNDFYRGCNE